MHVHVALDCLSSCACVPLCAGAMIINIHACDVVI